MSINRISDVYTQMVHNTRENQQLAGIKKLAYKRICTQYMIRFTQNVLSNKNMLYNKVSNFLNKGHCRSIFIL